MKIIDPTSKENLVEQEDGLYAGEVKIYPKVRGALSGLLTAITILIALAFNGINLSKHKLIGLAIRLVVLVRIDYLRKHNGLLMVWKTKIFLKSVAGPAVFLK